MKLKIISDGTSRGTTIVNAETGEKIDYVTSIEWSIDAQTGVASATIAIERVALEAMTTK